MSKAYPARVLGSLPADLINRTLGTELVSGTVRLSVTAHEHAAKDHPDDYPICSPLVESVIASPTFIGQAPRHQRNIELLRRVPASDGSAILVAVGIEPNDRGIYSVKSFYLVTEEEVERKRLRGHIKLAKKD